MPSYTMPDGSVHEFESDEVATRAYKAWDEQYGEKQVTQPAKPPAPPPAPEKNWYDPDQLAANPLTRFVTGAAAPIMGAGELIPGPIGKFFAENNADLKRLVNQGKVDQSDLVKIVGGAADIGGMIMSPAFLKLMKVLPAAKTFGQMARQGALVGTIGGLTAPIGSNDPKEKLIAGGSGTVTGGVATPVISSLGRMAFNAIGPMVSQRAAERGAARLASKAIGEPRQSIVAQAFSGASPQQTAAQAASRTGVYEVPALQGLVGQRHMPSQYGALEKAAEKARMDALRGVTPDLAAAEATRKAVTGPMYDAAKTGSVDTRPVLAEIDRMLSTVAPNNPLKIELQKLRGGLVDRARLGLPFTNPEKVMSAIDGLKGSIANKDNKFVQKTLMKLRDDLRKAIPGYQAADDEFARLSQPVDQANVLGRIADELPKPTGGERATAILNILGKGEDALIKKSTGMPRYVTGDLQKILDPKQMAVVDDIVGQIKSGAEITRQEGKGMIAAVKALREELDPNTAPALLNAKISFFNSLIRRLQGTGGDKVEGKLAEMMMPGQVNRLGKLMQDYRANPYGMMSAPARMGGIPAAAAATGMLGERQ